MPEEIVKRKRGRPRKNPLPEGEVTEPKKRGRPRIHPLPDPNEPVVPKKRGRPRKNPLPEGEVAESREPKKRGRPRKGSKFAEHMANLEIPMAAPREMRMCKYIVTAYTVDPGTPPQGEPDIRVEVEATTPSVAMTQMMKQYGCSRYFYLRTEDITPTTPHKRRSKTAIGDNEETTDGPSQPDN